MTWGQVSHTLGQKSVIPTLIVKLLKIFFSTIFFRPLHTFPILYPAPNRAGGRAWLWLTAQRHSTHTPTASNKQNKTLYIAALQQAIILLKHSKQAMYIVLIFLLGYFSGLMVVYQMCLLNVSFLKVSVPVMYAADKLRE